MKTVLVTGSGIGLGKVEFEFGKPAFLGIHSGYLVSLIPFGAGLIMLRLILRLFIPVPKIEIKGANTSVEKELTDRP